MSNFFVCRHQEPLFAARVIYDLLFFFMVIIIVLNLIFGVIIDTFADLRSEKQKKEEILKTTCFICGEEGSEACFNLTTPKPQSASLSPNWSLKTLFTVCPFEATVESSQCRMDLMIIFLSQLSKHIFAHKNLTTGLFICHFGLFCLHSE